MGLHDALIKARAELGDPPTDFDTLMGVVMGGLVAPVDVFFTDVLVMAEDPAVRENRLGLLATVHRLAAGALDWAALE